MVICMKHNFSYCTKMSNIVKLIKSNIGYMSGYLYAPLALSRWGSMSLMTG